MTTKPATTLHNTLGGFRQGTAMIDREAIFDLLGSPQEDWREKEHLDNKVKLMWYFDTPRGPAQVRDYWWNGDNEWTIAATNHKAALHMARYLRRLGVPASTRFNYLKDCKPFGESNDTTRKIHDLRSGCPVPA